MKELVKGFVQETLRQAVNQLVRGLTNAVNDVTLGTGTSTVVSDENVSPSTRIFFTGLNATGAAELAAGTLFVTTANIGFKTFTITHAAGPAGRQIAYTLRTGDPQ